MKALEVTEEQKDKLREMFTLFPEYELFVWNNGDSVTKYYIFNMTEQCFIHWFEFCITHLSKEIFYSNTNQLKYQYENHTELLRALMSYHLFGEGTHPIDYLYSQFKMPV